MSIRDDKEFMRLFEECLNEYEGTDYGAFILLEERLIDYIDKHIQSRMPIY